MENNKIRILQVLGSLLVGGAESRIMDVYRHLDRNMYDFDFLVFLEDDQYYEAEIVSYGGKIFKCQSPSMKNIFIVLNKIRKTIRNGNYNAVHAHTSYFSGVVMLAAKMEAVPVRITHARTTGTVREGRAEKALVELGKQLISRYATVRLAISNDAGLYMFGTKPFEVVPNAIDVEKYIIKNNYTIKKLRNKYGISEKSFVIGQIGRFNPMKNHMFTITWFHSYIATHPDAILLLIGDGYLKERIEEMTKKLGISEYVRFTGVVDNVNELIHLINVVLFPSIFEGLGGVVLEAQAAGVPTVMSDKLPIETDLGLGLVTRCSLNNDRCWSDAVDCYREAVHPTKERILDAFNKHNYSLDYELSRLYSIYKDEKE